MRSPHTILRSALLASAILAVAGIAAASGIATTVTATAPAASSPIVVVTVPAPPSAPQVALGTNIVKAAASVAVVPTDRHSVLAGVNLAGGEFGKVPGRIYYDYSYPGASEIDYYVARGFKVIRIPFRWERLQPDLYGALSTGDQTALRSAVTYARSKGLVVVLDMHDYARRRATSSATVNSMVGSTLVTESALADAWRRISVDYQSDKNVWFGLMNEPNGLGADDWWRTVQQLVVDLRGQHITNKFLIPGNSWTGAHSWIKSGNAALADKFFDPQNNFAFELHQYLDSSSAGTSPTCSVGAGNRVDAALEWAEARKVSVFFGEIGAGPNTQCAVEYGAMLQKINASRAVLGWTAWGGGKWWNTNYMFRLAPIADQPTFHMTMLQQNMPR